MNIEEYVKLKEKVKDKDCSLGCDKCSGKYSCYRLRYLEKWGYNPHSK